MAVTEEASSRSEAIYLDLRQKLLRGEFTPNYRLKLSELCAQRGVSVSVVREALTRLAEQGLIQSQPNKGFYIPNYSVEEINDLAFLRSHIEALAIRLAIVGRTSSTCSTMWSIIPYSSASSALNQRSRRLSCSIRSGGCPVCSAVSLIISFPVRSSWAA